MTLTNHVDATEKQREKSLSKFLSTTIKSVINESDGLQTFFPANQVNEKLFRLRQAKITQKRHSSE
jgi:hypothetical protein